MDSKIKLSRDLTAWSLLLAFICCCTALFPFTVKAGQNNKAVQDQHIRISRFISPETCAGCHSEIFEQWENSMHNLSHKDPVYIKVAQFLLKGLTDAGEIEEAESCVKCHTPVGYLSGYPLKSSDSPSGVPDIAKQGIQCDYCHSANSVEKLYNNGLVVEPGHGEDDPGTKYGPFDDSMPDFHEAQYSALHTGAKFCGTCHDVKHVAFGTELETTYTEWKNSPYNSKDPEKAVNCQGCHMYQRPGIPGTGSGKRPENPGSAADYSEERPHIFTHYFVGGNSYVPALIQGEPDTQSGTKSAMAVERLKNAAQLTINTNELAQKQFSVTITNIGAGHSIPTGLSNLRQLWLEITLKDKNGKILFQTGVPDKRHELSEDTISFRTVFGDEKGKATLHLAKARQVLSDNRIKAKESVTKLIKLPFVPAKDDLLTVRLLYRGMPAKLLNILQGEALKPLPVVEMAKAQRYFTSKPDSN